MENCHGERSIGNSPPEGIRLRQAAQCQFAHDLPQLLQGHFGHWVAYHGDRQVGIAKHTGELYEACRRQRLAFADVALFEIIPPDQEILCGPMAFD